jgi:hypothetical protein
MLKKLLYRDNNSKKFAKNHFNIISPNQFSNSNLKVNFLPKVTDEVDYDLIQFSENGMRFWVDYTGSNLKMEGLNQFLRGIIITSALSRISSMIKPIVKETLGPFSREQLKGCESKHLKVHDYYTKNSIGISLLVLI